MKKGISKAMDWGKDKAEFLLGVKGSFVSAAEMAKMRTKQTMQTTTSAAFLAITAETGVNALPNQDQEPEPITEPAPTPKDLVNDPKTASFTDASSNLKSSESLKSGSETVRFQNREDLPWDDMPNESREYMDKSWKANVLVLRSANAKLKEQEMGGNLGDASRSIMTHLEKYYTNCGVDVKFNVHKNNADIIDISADLYADDETQGLSEATDFLNTSETEGSELDQILNDFIASRSINREDVFVLIYVANNQGSRPGGGIYKS